MSESSDSIKVLLDTDIGTDIDDAVCLAYLLLQPRCDLLGITTVTGEAAVRAMLASAMCRVANRDVPVYPGAEEPILVPQRQIHAQQAESLPRWSHETVFPRGGAVEFLRTTIRRFPGEIVLLAIGPLTNIGLLFRTDPSVPKLLRGLVMMCGEFRGGAPGNPVEAEWNASGDPHATAIAYAAPVRLHRSVGLDVTRQVSMDEVSFRRTFASVHLFQPVLDFAEVWFREFDKTTFHDPLAAATIFTDGICSYERGTVTVSLTDGEQGGVTHFSTQNTPSPHEVAVSVDPVKFFDHFVSVVT